MNINDNDQRRMLSSDELSVEQVELRGFSRSMAELEWLLLILVLLYFIAPGTFIADSQSYIIAMLAFAAFVIIFHYLNFKTEDSRWKLAIESWVMIGFISWVSYLSGGVESPLINLYLLVIITSGLTLGKVTTLLEFGLITCIYLYLGYPDFSNRAFTLEDFTQLMIRFTPFLLVAYLVSMLAADLHFARRMFKHLSETDELTGLFNKRAFGKFMNREVAKAIRYSHAFSIIMIDADGLKAVNDEHGHESGDKLIREVANTIQHNLRDTDILARYGGDEFIVFLPETTTAQARDVAERVRNAAVNITYSANRKRIPVTVSIGVASYPEDTSNADDVVDRADRALYASKQQGRNRVTCFAEIRDF